MCESLSRRDARSSLNSLFCALNTSICAAISSTVDHFERNLVVLLLVTKIRSRWYSVAREPSAAVFNRLIMHYIVTIIVDVGGNQSG